ncbi:chondroadherin-like protein isoform X1 [Anopheles bellator]|uniref:chondroadherin-like protein isoform X1 n=1 Tax=Anopheles bellator TaxID=139047 RepID=UPI00264819D6|nr:chondroadherin-like protein isoform X1 [Anopheles bellator]
MTVWTLWLSLLIGVTVGAFGAGTRTTAKSSAQLFHYECNRLQESDQSWHCWAEGYRPVAANAQKFHESANATEADIRRILRFNQTNTVLFMVNSNSDNQNLRTEFSLRPNNIVRLALDNVGLETLQIGPFVGGENDCRLGDLSVPRNRLRELPPGVERLTVLRKLDMKHNLLQHFRLDRLAKATSLRRLLLGHNRLESFTTDGDVSFDSLQELDLSNNRLTTLDSSGWNMPALATFHVDHNRALASIGGWSKRRFPLVKGFDPTGTNNWNQTWLSTVQ